MTQNVISPVFDTTIQYTDLFESLPGSCILLQIDAPHYTILAATPEYCVQTVTTKEYLIGKGMFEAFPPNPDDPADTGTNDVRASLDHVRLYKKPHQLPVQRYDIAGQDGQLIQTYWSAINKPVFSSNGELAFIIHTAENITALIKSEQKEIEYQELHHAFKKVKESEAKYSTLFSSMDQGFCIIEMIFDQHHQPVDYVFVEINPVFETQTGLKSANGKTIKQLVPNLEAHWIERYGAVALTGQSIRFIERSEAMGRWFDVYAFKIGDRDNSKVAILFTDISDRKLSEEALKNQNTLIRTIADNATSTLFLMDNKGFCSFINSTGIKMFGYSMEELKQKPIHELIHHHRPDGSFYPWEECLLEKALHEGISVRSHKELFFKKDGTSFPALCSASPLVENGESVSAVIEVRDITFEIEAEQALRKSAAELEQKVTERTEELRTINEQLKQFTYAASHDLQEPLRKISFFLDRLIKNIGSGLSEDNGQIIARIQNTTERMRHLIEDLLSYSNTTQGTALFQELDLMTIAKEVLSDMEATIIEKNAQVQLQQLPQVKGDPRQMRQLFQNLISNALKYHKKGETPVVQISSSITKGERRDASDSVQREHTMFYEIQVKDNGIGFDPDDAERIFRLFQRLHGKAEYEGTGIGLAIVQKVVENHHGSIKAESEPEKGATFTVRLPVL
ncbi:MAG TPA: ATP-binding protein [Flavitalea sp.]|nr:ATP-binding protein [Flavitalea sp.]